MLKELEDLFPEGSDITIMNTYYNFPVYGENGKICDDFIALIYKDNTTKEKGFKLISKPEYTYYKAKNNVPLDHNRLFIEREKVEGKNDEQEDK